MEGLLSQGRHIDHFSADMIINSAIDRIVLKSTIISFREVKTCKQLFASFHKGKTT